MKLTLMMWFIHFLASFLCIPKKEFESLDSHFKVKKVSVRKLHQYVRSTNTSFSFLLQINAASPTREF